MREVRQAVHLNFDWDGDLLFDFFGGAAGPLGDYLDVIVGDVGIRFYRKSVEGNGAPNEQEEGEREDHEAVVEREVYQASHQAAAVPWWGLDGNYCSTVFCRTRALVTTWSPGFTPEMISCMLFGSISPPTTATRLNLFPPAGRYTQSRSCRCRMAAAGTAAWDSFFCPRKVAVTNMPGRMSPGLWTWIRTLAVRILGSRTAPILLIRPVTT